MVVVLLQEVHHGNVVVQSSRRTCDLVKVGRITGHLGQGGIELLCTVKVVKRHHDGSLGTQLLDLWYFQPAGGLEFNINDLASSFGRLSQNIEFGGDRTSEFSTVRHSTAGGDDGHVGMRFGELPNFGESKSRPLEVV